MGNIEGRPDPQSQLVQSVRLGEIYILLKSHMEKRSGMVVNMIVFARHAPCECAANQAGLINSEGLLRNDRSFFRSQRVPARTDVSYLQTKIKDGSQNRFLSGQALGVTTAAVGCFYEAGTEQNKHVI